MTKLGEVPKPFHEHAVTSRGLETVDLPQNPYGDKHQEGPVDYWNYPDASRIVVLTDRMYVEGSELIAPGLGAFDNALSNYHMKALHRKGIIRESIVGHPHANANIVKVPEEQFPVLEVSGYGIKVSDDGVLPEDPDVLENVWKIFSYGIDAHREAGFELERAQIQLGRFKDGKVTVISPLFTSSDMKVTAFFNFGARTRIDMAMKLAAAFSLQTGIKTTSQAEVSQAIDLHFNPTIK